MAKVGAPSIYSLELSQKICDALEQKKSLIQVCDMEGMPSRTTVQDWLHKYPEFASDYARARETGYDRYADEIFTLCQDLLEGPTRKEILEDLMDLYKEAATSQKIPDKHRIDDMLRTVVTHERVAAVRLRVDSIKWILAKMFPRKYGDSVSVEHQGEIQINQITRKVIDPLIINQNLTEKMLAYKKEDNSVEERP